MAKPTISMDEGENPEVNISDINEQIKRDTASKIKSRFLAVDTVAGRAQMFDTQTHAPGLDYTAGGQLTGRWVTQDDANILTKRKKGFKMPSEISPHLQNITTGNMVYMVRTTEAHKRHEDHVERLNQAYEQDAQKRATGSVKDSPGLGEFKVTPAATKRG